ncbi:C40 family peptidase [Demequina capsici]|uniref:NlpC/P60 family protein n=1 Tax=Demequina capsici TaxID=3075620 RepID=A0AA96F7E0_9MICO|nr:NlpC/P60 family protein [Demequina sp. OYTSA14]WNM24969.1 NlpC/P60 family protein [Demequina sp. OYTSA14]
MRYGYKRARARAIAVSAGGALVIVPLAGVAAMALVTPGEQTATTPDAAVVAEVNASLAQDIAEASTVVVASGNAAYDFQEPSIEVSADPKPVTVKKTTTTTTSGSSARTVANSNAVAAAISGSAIVAEAAKYVGTPYRSGGSSPSTGFDCSGFVSYVYAQFGISLPHYSGAYYSIGTRVSSPQPGDIIVTPGHVAIYAGPNLQIDAPVAGKTVQFRSIWQTNPVYIRITG